MPESYYGRTLADLMRQRGDRQASIELQRGDIQAQGWMNAGNAITGAISGWQRDVEANRQRELDAAKEARVAEREGMQLESARMDLSTKKRATEGAEKARAVLPLARRQNGVVGYDRDLIQREMETAGHADLVPDIFKGLDEQEAGHLKVIEARRDAIAGDAWRVIQGGRTDPETFNAMVDLWTENDLAPKRELDALRKVAEKDGVEPALMAAVTSSPRFAEMLQQMRAANAPKLGTVAPGASVYDERNPEAGPLFTAPVAPKEPTNIEDAILQATRAGNQEEVDRLVGIKERIARAGRTPAQAPQPASVQRGAVVDGDTDEAIEGYFDPKARSWHRMDGSVITNPKPASAREKTSTGAQKRVFQFFQRAAQAEEDIAGVEDEIAGQGTAGQAYTKFAPNFMQTEKGQLYNQSQRAFTEARLRKDSGAAIPPHEYANDRKTYFAEPGDSAAVKEQKRRARANVLSALAFESGGAVSEFYGDEADALISSLRERARGGKPAEKKNDGDGWTTVGGMRIRKKAGQ